jgi:ferredoxin, 2Fe-2S
MTKVTFVAPDGHRQDAVARPGDSAKDVALSAGIHAIVGECGGAMACATCHVYVDPDWAAQVGPASAGEADMLEFAACEARVTSRLSCQITLTPELDGLVLYLPESQI